MSHVSGPVQRRRAASAGGAGDGTGSAGSDGGDGKVLVFVKGTLKFRSGFGVSAPDLNNL